MGHTIPYQKSGLFARDIIVVSNIKNPVETSSRRVESGTRYCDQYNSELSHQSCQGSNLLRDSFLSFGVGLDVIIGVALQWLLVPIRARHAQAMLELVAPQLQIGRAQMWKPVPHRPRM